MSSPHHRNYNLHLYLNVTNCLRKSSCGVLDEIAAVMAFADSGETSNAFREKVFNETLRARDGI